MVGGGPLLPQPASPTSARSPTATAVAHLQPVRRSLYACPKHPEEPLVYACATCQRHCICAECALRGEHTGHDILLLREAVAALPERAAELAGAARTAARRQSAVAQSARGARRNIATVTNMAKQALQRSLAKLLNAIDQEEAVLMSEADGCSKDVAEVLGADVEASLSEAIEGLSTWRSASSPAQALQCYAKLKKVMEKPSQKSSDAGRELALQLRGQLRAGFEGRLSGIEEVQLRVDSLPAWPARTAR